MPVWTIFRNNCALRVVQTKFWNRNTTVNKEIEAFLDPEIGGIVGENGFAQKPSSQYYFQLQLQMFVSELSLIILVVWTKQGVFTVELPFNPSFMTKVCFKLDMFWSQQILLIMMNNLVSTIILLVCSLFF